MLFTQKKRMAQDRIDIQYMQDVISNQVDDDVIKPHYRRCEAFTIKNFDECSQICTRITEKAQVMIKNFKDFQHEQFEIKAQHLNPCSLYEGKIYRLGVEESIVTLWYTDKERGRVNLIKNLIQYGDDHYA